MAQIVKTPTAATSGYIRYDPEAPPSKTAYFPNGLTPAGIDVELPDFTPLYDRGYVTFPIADLPALDRWQVVTLAVDPMGYQGSSVQWGLEIYTGVDLDLAHLDNTWTSGTLAATITSGFPPPTSISETIPEARWAGMIVDGQICIRLVDVSDDGHDPRIPRLWEPDIANTTLTIQYLAVQSKITLTSSIRSQVSGTSTLHRTPSGASAAGTQADLASSVDTQADETSEISQTVSAESGAGTTADLASNVHPARTYDADIATTADGESSVAPEADLASSAATSTSKTSAVSTEAPADSDTNLEEV